MFALRPISIGDVVSALHRREIVLALHISGNLCSNSVSTVRSSLRAANLLPRPVRRQK